MVEADVVDISSLIELLRVYYAVDPSLALSQH